MKPLGKFWQHIAVIPQATEQTGWQWAETIAIPGLALGIAWLIQPENPFFLQHGFHWPWIAPLLIALRYGTFPGLVAGGVLLAAWPLQNSQLPFPYAYFLGGFILTMIAGEFGGQWRTRIRRLNELNYYLEERIEQLARRHHLLRLSHERLEQNLISRPITLRDALSQLSALLQASTEHRPLPAAQAFLTFLSQACQFEQAAIFECVEKKLAPIPLATTGTPDGYRTDDPLISFAMKRKQLSHIQHEGIHDGSELMLALPLTTSTGEIRGMLVVRQMPFFAFTDDTLQMLSALGIYYVERIVVKEVAEPILDVMPDCPPEFAYEVFKLQRVQRETGITSAIVVLVFKPGSRQQEIFKLISRQQRSQDMAWTIQQGHTYILATLMPLSTLTAVEGYLARIEGLLQTRFGMDLNHAGIAYSQVDLARPGGLLLLQDILRRHRD